MYHFYVLYSKKLDALHVGQCGASVDLALKRHFAEVNGNVRHEDEWTIAYKERIGSKVDAAARLREVKRWPQRKLKRLANL